MKLVFDQSCNMGCACLKENHYNLIDSTRIIKSETSMFI